MSAHCVTVREFREVEELRQDYHSSLLIYDPVCTTTECAAWKTQQKIIFPGSTPVFYLEWKFQKQKYRKGKNTKETDWEMCPQRRNSWSAFSTPTSHETKSTFAQYPSTWTRKKNKPLYDFTGQLCRSVKSKKNRENSNVINQRAEAYRFLFLLSVALIFVVIHSVCLCEKEARGCYEYISSLLVFFGTRASGQDLETDWKGTKIKRTKQQQQQLPKRPHLLGNITIKTTTCFVALQALVERLQTDEEVDDKELSILMSLSPRAGQLLLH